MSRIEAKFRNRHGARALVIPFLNAGDPTFEVSLSAFEAAIANGAEVIEIGVPYSDPLADGPVIQASALRSLAAGFSLPRAFEVAKALRERTDAALIMFTYVNPLLQYGLEKFYADAKAVGVDGTIVPDLPSEESKDVLTVADKHGIDLVPLLAPTSGRERIATICENARGFVYCVSSLGVTGERAKMSDRLREMVSVCREHTDLPIGVGFGVRGPEQANDIASFADGVIVGSAYVRRVEAAIEKAAQTEANGLSSSVTEAVGQFTRELVQAVQ